MQHFFYRDFPYYWLNFQEQLFLVLGSNNVLAYIWGVKQICINSVQRLSPSACIAAPPVVPWSCQFLGSPWVPVEVAPPQQTGRGGSWGTGAGTPAGAGDSWKEYCGTKFKKHTHCSRAVLQTALFLISSRNFSRKAPILITLERHIVTDYYIINVISFGFLDLSI